MTQAFLGEYVLVQGEEVMLAKMVHMEAGSNVAEVADLDNYKLTYPVNIREATDADRWSAIDLTKKVYKIQWVGIRLK